MGEVKERALMRVNRTDSMPLEELWTWKHPFVSGNRALGDFHAWSWLWVHFLINRYPDEFRGFQAGLGRAEEPRTAWRRAFASVPQEKLDADVHALRARLLAIGPAPYASDELAERIRAELHAALPFANRAAQLAPWFQERHGPLQARSGAGWRFTL